MKKYWDTMDRGQRDGVLWVIGIVLILWSILTPIAVIELMKMWSGC